MLGKIRSLFRKSERLTFDLTRHTGPIWSKEGGKFLTLCDWRFFGQQDPQPGDFVILEGDVPGTTTRYKILSFRRMIDPRDMWFADAEFAPRSPREK